MMTQSVGKIGIFVTLAKGLWALRYVLIIFTLLLTLAKWYASDWSGQRIVFETRIDSSYTTVKNIQAVFFDDGQNAIISPARDGSPISEEDLLRLRKTVVELIGALSKVPEPTLKIKKIASDYRSVLAELNGSLIQYKHTPEHVGEIVTMLQLASIEAAAYKTELEIFKNSTWSTFVATR